ncbi:hypothetical protein KDU71_05185 [Carboxylicivirga sediminis]|uniref:General secretion pathway protein n=1 Tax=Carboxylicivirga sediminis TaxID=2006564 RepID=A0A941IV09_9BACT|nr:hypothetical protein [Carboxylicivirga sediminis]MBR8534946.1 hypothetical protein [Carboxylicivirga sediminis]
MFDNLSNKKKFYLMLVGAVILIWLSFKLGVNKTFELKEQLDHRREQLMGIQDAPRRLQQIEQQLEDVERLIGDASGEDASPYLIEKAANYCKKNKLVLNEIPIKHVFTKDELSVVTYQLKVQGAFKKLLRLLDELEHHSAAGKLRSVRFESEYNLRKKKKELFGVYYIQSVGANQN